MNELMAALLLLLLLAGLLLRAESLFRCLDSWLRTGWMDSPSSLGKGGGVDVSLMGFVPQRMMCQNTKGGCTAHGDICSQGFCYACCRLHCPDQLMRYNAATMKEATVVHLRPLPPFAPSAASPIEGPKPIAGSTVPMPGYKWDSNLMLYVKEAGTATTAVVEESALVKATEYAPPKPGELKKETETDPIYVPTLI